MAKFERDELQSQKDVPGFTQPKRGWRVLATLVVAGLAAQGCVAWGTPIPWMMGPLVATALLGLAGVPVASAHALRNSGQWVIGVALGLYFTPEVGRLIGSLVGFIALGVVWACAAGWLFGRFLNRTPVGAWAELSGRARAATVFFSGAIGGASEMTLIAERHGARADLVASAHSLRVLMVTLTLPFAMQAWGIQGIDGAANLAREVHLSGMALLGLATAAGVWVMHRLGRANPWLIGALLVTMSLTLADVRLTGLPPWLTNAAQLVIGVSLGVRFSPAFLRTAPRWLAAVAVGTGVLMLACAAFGAVLAWAAGLHPATLILGTSPGGIAEMAITAKVLQLGVPVVTAFQVCRLVAVLVLAEPLFAWLLRTTPAEAN